MIARDYEKVKNNNTIKINFDVEYRGGSEKMHSKPTMVVFPDQIGDVKFTTESGHSYEMQVIAKRV